MENSFYYFFSATPQVLGGVLALFGVFVIFKLQSLSIELLSVGKEFFHYTLGYNNAEDTKEMTQLRNKMHAGLERSIDSQNINSFKVSLDMDVDNKIYPSDLQIHFKEKFINLYEFHKSLRDETLNSSYFTAIIIILCLALIPFEKWLICKPALLFIMFFTVIMSIVFIFYKLLSSLKKSIN